MPEQDIQTQAPSSSDALNNDWKNFHNHDGLNSRKVQVADLEFTTPVPIASGGTGATTAATARAALGVPNINGDTFTGDVSVPDEAYGSGWNGSVEVPTKNAVYDKIETLSITFGLRTICSTVFEDSARFIQNGTGGTATFGTEGVLLDTTATVSRFYRLRARNYGTATFKTFSGSPQFVASATITTVGANIGEYFIGMGAVTTAASGHTWTDNHIGFRVHAVSGTASLYATQADGSTNNQSSALTTFTAETHLDLYAIVNSTTSVDYYWRKDGGTLSAATNLTSNLPTADDNTWFQGSVSNHDTNSQYAMQCEGAAYYR